jgi:hypothetical protein
MRKKNIAFVFTHKLVIWRHRLIGWSRRSRWKERPNSKSETLEKRINSNQIREKAREKVSKGDVSSSVKHETQITKSIPDVSSCHMRRKSNIIGRFTSAFTIKQRYSFPHPTHLFFHSTPKTSCRHFKSKAINLDGLNGKFSDHNENCLRTFFLFSCLFIRNYDHLNWWTFESILNDIFLSATREKFIPFIVSRLLLVQQVLSFWNFLP